MKIRQLILWPFEAAFIISIFVRPEKSIAYVDIVFQAYDKYKWGRKERELILDYVLFDGSKLINKSPYPEGFVYHLTLIKRLADIGLVNEIFIEEIEILQRRIADFLQTFEASFNVSGERDRNISALKDYFQGNREFWEETKSLIERNKIT